MKSINITKISTEVIISLLFSISLSSVSLFLYYRFYRQILKYKLYNYIFQCSFGIKTGSKMMSQITALTLLQVQAEVSNILAFSSSDTLPETHFFPSMDVLFKRKIY